MASGSMGKYKKVSSCKLKVSGKDWLLPNIQSRKQLAFAAAGSEEISRLFCTVSSESTDWESKASSLHDLQENMSYNRTSLSFWGSLQFLLGLLVGVKASNVLQKQWANADLLQRMLLPSWESWCTHAHSQGDRVGQKNNQKKKLAVSIFRRISLFLFFISLPRSSAFSVLWHVFCMYVFACLNVRSCVRVHVASLRSQKTLSVYTGGPGSSGLGFSDSLLCYLHVVCPAPDERHLSPYLFCLSSFSQLAPAFCCSCTKYLSTLRERALHIKIGERVRQRCQCARWVKGEGRGLDKGEE